MISKFIRTILVVCIFSFAILDGLSERLYSQDKNIIAIVPPFIDRRNTGESESSLQLVQQRFVIFIYRNAAAVYTEADFMNDKQDTVGYELALPSTGFQEKNNTDQMYQSNGILSVQMWITGERVQPEVQQDGDVEWYTARTMFPPSMVTKVKALFWVQTSLTDIDSMPGLDTVNIQDGKRGFLLDLSQAAIWQDVIGSFDAVVVFKEGLSPTDTLDANPDNYDVTDSTISWSMNNIEPSMEDNISLFYDSAVKNESTLNTMEKLSRFIVQRTYDDVLEYVRQIEED